MSVGDALRKLQAAGRIRSAWLAGMGARRQGVLYRVMDWDPDEVGDQVVSWVWPSGVVYESRLVTAEAEPDLTDPCTRGGLLELLREARRDSTIATEHHSHSGDAKGGGPYDPPEPEREWWTCYGNGPAFGPEYEGPPRDTEGEAIAAALVAIAEGLP